MYSAGVQVILQVRVKGKKEFGRILGESRLYNNRTGKLFRASAVRITQQNMLGYKKSIHLMKLHVVTVDVNKVIVEQLRRHL